MPFSGEPGSLNAITDVPGVLVASPSCPGTGPWSRARDRCARASRPSCPRGRTFDPVHAGWSAFNGNGDLTRTHWISESGFLETPVLITGTGSVGTVRDAAWQWLERNGHYAPADRDYW